MKYTSIFILVLMLFAACARTTKPTAVRQPESQSSGGYSLYFESKTLDNDTTVRVFLQTTVPNLEANQTADQLAQRFSINYNLISDYNSRDVLGSGSITLNDQSVRRLGNDTLNIRFDIAKLGIPNALLQLQLIDQKNGQKYLHSVPVRFRAQRFSDVYAVFEPQGLYPKLRHYFHETDTLQIRDLRGTPKVLTVVRYKHEFDPALSPMATSGRSVAPTMEVDTIFTLPTNQMFVLQEPGLYYFRGDTTEVSGIGIRVVGRRFPRMTRPEELVKPLIYISSNSEIKELASTTAPKRTLDTYWLRLTSGNEAKAKRTIRSYYRRVTQANQLFTTYKEGWKTDMGMVYIVFGKPDQVTRLKDREVWTYTQNPNFSEINFTFARRPNQFVEDHYELVRYVEYEPIWFPTVEEWRNGIAER
jgi:GWxTD domain-containing protein